MAAALREALDVWEKGLMERLTAVPIKPETKLFFTSFLMDQSPKMWNGMIYVAPEAQREYVCKYILRILDSISVDVAEQGLHKSAEAQALQQWSREQVVRILKLVPL